MDAPIVDRSLTRVLTRRSGLKSVQVPGTYATHFFKVIAAHSFALRNLQREQMGSLQNSIIQFSLKLVKVTVPTRISGRKSDLDVWRTIVKMFMDADVLSMELGDTVVSDGQLDCEQRLTALQNEIAEKRLVHTTAFTFQISRALYCLLT
jgi:hypothetical protein